MCTYTMESVVDPCDQAEILDDAEWLNKYVETENIFLDYLKSITFASFNADSSADTILPEYDGTESGFEAMDHLYDLLVSLCDNSDRLERVETGSNAHNSDAERKKHEPRSKRNLKCLSSHYGKELQVQPNRARSHSSVGVDEILRTQEFAGINVAESRRKSRRVSLGMRPKFSNWSKVKGAFKRDKSNSRIDSRDGDYQDYSGDEGTDKVDSQFSSSHENIGQISSSEEDFECYVDGFGVKKDLNGEMEDENSLKAGLSVYRSNMPEKTIPKSKSAIGLLQSHKSCNSPTFNSPLHKNPFKWYRTKSITPTGVENGPPDGFSTPPSPFKNAQFLYDEDSVNKINDDPFSNSAAESNFTSNEILQEVQNKYESLQKRLSREFYVKYHDRKRNRDSGPEGEEEKMIVDFEDPKLMSYLAEQNLSPEFKQKFHEWQKMKGQSVSPTRAKTKNENPHSLKKSKSDWHKWRPGSKSESNVLKFLDKEQNESHHGVIEGANLYCDLEDNGTAYLPACKKHTIDIFKNKNNKELAWLEKELQKVAREKQRLEKEKEKYAERETRLRNMRKAIKSGRKRKQEVLVPTSTGLFRFQGISSKFTRKLYEWEKAKGITAESSTFALLNSYYGGNESQRNNKYSSDTTTLLSRSRSVGSVEVAGVGNSILQSGSNHQQSSLSLNDMEQLEEAQLQVENDNLMQSASQLFEKENDNELDLISTESLIIPDYSENLLTHGIPIISSSIKPTSTQESSLNNLHKIDYVREDNNVKLLETYDSLAEVPLRSCQCDTDSQVLPNKEEKNSANADAESIVDQIKKLRAGTSIDDEDRMNVLTNLQHLADQLLEMVHNMNDKKNENVDELAIKIADLAVALKKEIKILTADELQTNYGVNEKLPGSSSNVRAKFDGFQSGGEDLYSDTEDNDSPTVHCTFTLPSWRVKYTTPSSTESESSNRNKYADSRQARCERQRKHFKDDNSSGGDENYDGSDETTMYLDLRSMKNQQRRESSDNISTSNSESIVNSEIRDRFLKNYRLSPELKKEPNQEILHCSLVLKGKPGNEAKEVYGKPRRLHTNKVDVNVANTETNLIDEKRINDHEIENQPSKTECRSYSPKPINSKRKCSSCGKVKRISKCRKNTTNYCVCSKRETEKSEPNIPRKISENSLTAFKRIQDCDEYVPKSASYSNPQDLGSPKMGKLLRSKVYDFNTLKTDEKFGRELDTIRTDNDHSVNVIVPTTRKIFAPLKQDENGGTSAVVSFTIDELEDGAKRDDSEEKLTDVKDKDTNLTPPVTDLHSKSVSPSVLREESTPKLESKKSILEMHVNIDRLPPTSPLSIKRNANKEGNNSSIKMMIAHYNKLMTENPEKKLSEGQCWTPTLQKSPVLERCNRFETLHNSSQMNNIRKSKSAVLSTKNRKLEIHDGSGAKKESLHLGISKSSSADSIQCPRANESDGSKIKEVNENVEENQEERTEMKTSLQPLDDITPNDSSSSINTMLSNVMPLERNSSFESVLSETKLRNLRLQEAKNKFFNEYPSKVTIECVTPNQENLQNTSEPKNSAKEAIVKKPEQRCSNLETDSNLNLALNKSVSTGNINDRSKSRNLPTGYEKSSSKSKLSFSNIASKFRKVKMRRHKEPEVSAVSSLCRASLFVNIDKDGKSKEYLSSSKSCPSSPVMQRNMAKRNSSSN